MFCFFSFLFLKLLTVGRLFFFHHKHCFLFLFVSLMIALQLLSFLVPQTRCLHVATGNVTPVNTLSFPSISSCPHRLTLTFTVGIPYLYFFFLSFYRRLASRLHRGGWWWPPSIWEPVSWSRSWWEKWHLRKHVRVCLCVFTTLENLVLGRWEQYHYWPEMPESMSQTSLPGRPLRGLFRMKMYSRPTTRNDPKMQGFMGIRRPALACDSLLCFMLEKPSITTLTQSKPQSGMMLVFGVFSCFFNLVQAAVERVKYSKKAQTSQHA